MALVAPRYEEATEPLWGSVFWHECEILRPNSGAVYAARICCQLLFHEFNISWPPMVRSQFAYYDVWMSARAKAFRTHTLRSSKPAGTRCARSSDRIMVLGQRNPIDDRIMRKCFICLITGRSSMAAHSKCGEVGFCSTWRWIWIKHHCNNEFNFLTLQFCGTWINYVNLSSRVPQSSTDTLRREVWRTHNCVYFDLRIAYFEGAFRRL